MHSTVATLTGSAENLETSSQTIKNGIIISQQFEVVIKL
jgi:hypothetical protein